MEFAGLTAATVNSEWPEAAAAKAVTDHNTKKVNGHRQLVDAAEEFKRLNIELAKQMGVREGAHTPSVSCETKI